MPTNPNPMTTDFSRDVLGRYVCNGLDEALRSADRTRPDARPFDVIVIGVAPSVRFWRSTCLLRTRRAGSYPRGRTVWVARASPKPADAWAQPTFADNHCRATKREPI